MLPAYKSHNKRAKVRLNLATGYVELKREGLPNLRCSLRDLSEGGFQCVAAEAEADPTAYTAWKIFLSSSQKLALAGVVLNLEPYLVAVPLRAEIRFQKIRPQGELIFGMGLKHVSQSQQEMLRRAVLDLAMTKLRQAPVDEKELGTGAVNGESPVMRRRNRMDPFRGRRIGEVLVNMGKLDQAQIKDAGQRAKDKGLRLGTFLTREGWVHPADLCQALALQSGLPMIDLAERTPGSSLRELLPFETLNRYEAVPFEILNDVVRFASSQPLDATSLKMLSKACGHRVELYLAQEHLLHHWLFRMHPPLARADKKAALSMQLPVQFQFCSHEGVRMENEIHTGYVKYLTPAGFLLECNSLDYYTPPEVLREQLGMRVGFFFAPDEYKGVAQIKAVTAKRTAGAPGGSGGVGLTKSSPSDSASAQMLRQVGSGINLPKPSLTGSGTNLRGNAAAGMLGSSTNLAGSGKARPNLSDSGTHMTGRSTGNPRSLPAPARRPWVVWLEITEMEQHQRERLRSSCINTGFWRTRPPKLDWI